MNTARLMLPRSNRGHVNRPAETPLSKVGWTTFEMGRLYAEMGFTTVVEPARFRHITLCTRISNSPIRRSSTRRFWRSLAMTILRSSLLRSGEGASARSAITSPGQYAYKPTRALGIKVVNAGGVAAFKDNIRSFSFDDVVPYYGVTSRAIVKALQKAVHDAGVPHPLHVHCNNLGLPGKL